MGYMCEEAVTWQLAYSSGINNWNTSCVVHNDFVACIIYVVKRAGEEFIISMCVHSSKTVVYDEILIYIYIVHRENNVVDEYINVLVSFRNNNINCKLLKINHSIMLYINKKPCVKVTNLCARIEYNSYC